MAYDTLEMRRRMNVAADQLVRLNAAQASGNTAELAAVLKELLSQLIIDVRQWALGHPTDFGVGEPEPMTDEEIYLAWMRVANRKGGE